MARAIVGASRRTDIPAFYARWWMERVRAGWVEWVHPFGGGVRRASLRPEDVLAIVFWTRHPGPLIPYLHELEGRGYRFYFHVTVNGYPRAIEPHSPPAGAAVRAFRALADRIGPERVLWRYDPIVVGKLGGDSLDAGYHLRQFEALARQLAGATRRCTVSFVSLYAKTARRLGQVMPGLSPGWPAQRRRELAADLAAIAWAYGMSLQACCDDALVGAGRGEARVAKARCVDPELVAALRPGEELHLEPGPSRAQCGCARSVDVGAYDTCLFGCAYCYATRSQAAALARFRAHRPADTMLARPAASRGAA
ncbi:DUF1848 domain-containing protein [Carboxydochorda subterranea]|uniref:DUF1848 domain-containing protein n=1 Tax=Carboxydichorda subterranea TaxID=3109565 RepID=A0ABZ1BTP3_9FIRM|nr:DUF1848 domain-containing protein [Limnochorda sp. L945t]WRP16149.1 DUF1848 domain-containing protein [Limnochorda sp. L945t]